MDEVHKTHAGQPVQDVIAELRSAGDHADWQGTDDDYLPWAQAISKGNRIKVRLGDIEL